MKRPKHIENFLNDVTTALPYSDYIRANIGNYVIINEKPHVIKGVSFRHIQDETSTNYIVQCFVKVENINESAYFGVSLSQDQITNCMDNPMILIDLINAYLRQKLKFVAKNKTTDLLFKNEG